MRNFVLAITILLLSQDLVLAQNTHQRNIQNFARQSGSIINIGKGTNSLNFIRFPMDQALQLSGNLPKDKAMSFLQKYPDLFETRSTKNTYQVKESKTDNYDLDHVVLQQYYDNVPVFDGVLKFHFNKEGRLNSVNGNFIAAEKLDVTPSWSSEAAGQQAIKLVTKQKMGKFSAPLRINKNNLLVFQKGLAQGYKGAVHLVYEVEVRNDADVREFLYIDAHTKELVEQFTGMHSIDRKLYETSVSAPNLKWQEADGTGGSKFATLDKWQKSEVESAGHIYNLMKNAFGFNSFDNAGSSMVTINNNPQIKCPNANWNGLTANYCTGSASDDIVAHEWGHAYTEHTSGLIYAWQAGALNEAYSDIWGETVDQLNGYFDNGENNAIRTNCSNSARWKIGEQASAFGGAIRDMWDPTCNNNPGKVSDTQYLCMPQDNGGVHTNSGIINHAFALLVDGGSYNGQNITGLGLTKAAHIFWRVQSEYNTSTTDFAAQADMLEAALVDLAGVNLPMLSTNGQTGLSGIKIQYSDLAQLIKVIAAVEMKATACFLNPIAQPLFKPLPPLCRGALSTNAFFYENFENGIGAWTLFNSGIHATWSNRNWALNNKAPGGRSGTVAFAGNFKGGDCINDMQDGLMSLVSPQITIPIGKAGPYYLSFDHLVSLESDADGGNLQYKLSNGPWVDIPKSAFTGNPYNTTLWDDNPLSGKDCFSGGDGISFVSHWGESRINLSALGLSAGQTIQFCFNLGSNSCGAWEGWFIDDIKVYSCTMPTVQFETLSTSINEAESTTAMAQPSSCLSYIEKKISVKINQAPSQPVLVTMNDPVGTAKPGVSNDFDFSPKSFTLQAGALSKDVLLRVYNDANTEGIETLTLSYNLSNPNGGNATMELFNQQHEITINDDDLNLTKNTLNLIDENFNKGIPTGWQVTNDGNFPESWGVVDYKNAQKIDPLGTPYLYTNSDWGFQIPGKIDRIIETQPFNSLNAKSLSISFIEFYFPTTGINNFFEQATVDIWDGSSWHTLLLQNQTTGMSGSWEMPISRNIPIPLAYRNAAMKIRFRYLADWNGWWAIDNVKVSASYNNSIQTLLSANADKHYLGPNATVYFRDPASGNLLLKVKNLTSHDYGCTSVEIDRAGAGKVNWVGSKSISKKSFRIIPSNDNPNGKYEITLYYKTSELTGFNGADIKSIGKSEGSILQANEANSMTELVQMAIFNNDLAYTATFNSGFGGFGLSDAPAGEALPVKFVRFEGRHTPEGNVLIWETMFEEGTDRFEIERSMNSKDFLKIGEVKAGGNLASAQRYSYTDTAFVPGSNYYRLKQIDLDSYCSLSRIIEIENGSEKQLVFPNPFDSHLEIQVPAINATSAYINVLNSVGQIVLRKAGIKIENNSAFLDLSFLPAGIYQITLNAVNKVYHYKVVKAP